MALRKMLQNKKGFTLAELLVVVAIIAVLTGVAIPVFSGQLEKSREAVDLANVRSIYGEVMTVALLEDTASPYHQADGSYVANVTLEQAADDWDTKMDDVVVGGVAYVDNDHWLGSPRANGTCEVSFKGGEIFLNWGDGTKGPTNPTKQDHINTISAPDFLTKEILTEILGDRYPYGVINSNESDAQGEGTAKFNQYAAAKGFDLSADYNAKTWQILVKGQGQMLDQPAIYWSTLELNDEMIGKSVPVMGYRDGKYDVWCAKVTKYNTENGKPPYLSLTNGFANVTNDPVTTTATFQFDKYEDALAAYEKLMEAYDAKGTVTSSDLSKNGL